EEREAIKKREDAIDYYIDHFADKVCGQDTYHPAYLYILVNGAIRLARLAQDETARGRDVGYANLGLIFPKERTERIPYFIDPAHMTDAGADRVARFYADWILRERP